MKIQYKVQSLYLLIGVTHTTRNYSINEEKITTLLEITRVPSNFLLPYPTLLGFEKPLLVIACLHSRDWDCKDFEALSWTQFVTSKL